MDASPLKVSPVSALLTENSKSRGQRPGWTVRLWGVCSLSQRPREETAAGLQESGQEERWWVLLQLLWGIEDRSNQDHKIIKGILLQFSCNCTSIQKILKKNVENWSSKGRDILTCSCWYRSSWILHFLSAIKHLCVRPTLPDKYPYPSNFMSPQAGFLFGMCSLQTQTITLKTWLFPQTPQSSSRDTEDITQLFSQAK